MFHIFGQAVYAASEFAFEILGARTNAVKPIELWRFQGKSFWT